MLSDPTTGYFLKEGETMKLSKLAQTLRTIADEGAETFHSGSLADDIVADVQDAGIPLWF